VPCYTSFLRLTRVHNPNGISKHGPCTWVVLTGARNTLPVITTREHRSCAEVVKKDTLYTRQYCPCTRLPGPTRVPKPNGISIGSAVFAGLITIRDRQTDRQATLFGLYYARSTAMRPNNGTGRKISEHLGDPLGGHFLFQRIGACADTTL